MLTLFYLKASDPDQNGKAETFYKLANFNEIFQIDRKSGQISKKNGAGFRENYYRLLVEAGDEVSQLAFILRLSSKFKSSFP